MRHPSWLQIDLGRLARNVRCWRAALASDGGAASRLCAVVKADAYGLGAPAVARALTAAPERADMLAVYSPDQADELLAHGIDDTPILLLMPGSEPLCSTALIVAAQTGRLHVSIDSPEQLDRLSRDAVRRRCHVHAHLHLDTGMSRGGLSETELTHAVDRLAQLPNIVPAAVMSHFAAADRDGSFSRQQLDRLSVAVRPLRDRLGRMRNGDAGTVLVHAAATAAAARDRCTHLDMARIGLGLYGFGTKLGDGAPPIAPLGDQLHPVLSWFSRIVHVQRYPAGSRVGYGDGHTLSRDSIIAVVPVGYGEGYPLALTGKAQVCVHGAAAEPRRFAPVVGQINMDQMTIDLTDAPKSARVGATVELISADPASACAVPRLAEQAGTSCYELLCRLSPRVPRCYVHASADGVVIESISSQRADVRDKQRQVATA